MEPVTGKEKFTAIPVAIAEPEERQDFIRKVYGILSAQLLVTVVLAGGMVHHGHELRHHPAVVMGAVTLSCFVALSVAMISWCCPGVMRRYPHNLILLGVFTVAESVLVGHVCLNYTLGSVLMCLAITAAVVFGLTVYACRAKSDFTSYGPYLVCFLLALAGTGLVLSLMAACGLASSAVFGGLQLLYAWAGALVFSAFLVYDTQLILGGTHEHEFSIDDYAMAALCIYLDIIQLFLALLRIMGRSDNDI